MALVWMTACAAACRSSADTTRQTEGGPNANAGTSPMRRGPGEAANPAVPAPNPALQIDDQSATKGAQIALTALRMPSGKIPGSWRTYGSNAATGAALTPAEGDPFSFASFDSGPFPHAACVRSSGFVGSFAGEGFNFATVIGDGARPVAAPIDLSAFTGFTFWAKSLSRTWLRVKVQDDQTYGADRTASCHNADAGGPCNDDFSADNVPLSSAWTQILVAFTDLTQNDMGAQFPALDARGVFGIEFEVEGAPDGGGAPFQFCVARIGFTKP
jgi:hypothetical protein